MAAMLGLCAALGWGLTDFLAGPTARRAGIGATMMFTSLAGLAALAIWICAGSDATFGRLFGAAAHASFIWTVVAGLLSAVASLFLTTGLAVGKSAIVAPIAMSYGAVATTLSLLAGEAFRPAALTGLLLCVIGAPLTALDRHRADFPDGAVATGILFATGAAVCYGAGFWMQGRFSVPQLGAAGALLINYVCSVLIALVVLVNGRNASRVLLRSPRFIVQAIASIAALACLAAGTGGRKHRHCHRIEFTVRRRDRLAGPSLQERTTLVDTDTRSYRIHGRRGRPVIVATLADQHRLGANARVRR